MKVVLKNIALDVLQVCDSEEEAYAEITRVLEEKHIKPYYYRSNLYDDKIVIDYGSHTNFFEIIFLKEEE